MRAHCWCVCVCVCSNSSDYSIKTFFIWKIFVNLWLSVNLWELLITFHFKLLHRKYSNQFIKHYYTVRVLMQFFRSFYSFLVACYGQLIKKCTATHYPFTKITKLVSTLHSELNSNVSINSLSFPPYWMNDRSLWSPKEDLVKRNKSVQSNSWNCGILMK